MKDFLMKKAATYAPSLTVKPYLQENIEYYFQMAFDQIEEMKEGLDEDTTNSKALTKIVKALKDKTNELHAFVSDDAQLDILSSIIGTKLDDYASIEDFKKALEKSPAVLSMKAYAKEVMSVDIYKVVSAVIVQSGKIKSLKKAEQSELVETLKSDKIAVKLSNLNLNKALEKFKDKGRDLCKELKLSAADTKSIMTIITKIETQHLEDFKAIKKDLEKHLPDILKKSLEYVYTECPHLKIEAQGKSKAVTHSFAAKRGKEEVSAQKHSASKVPAEAASQKRSATLNIGAPKKAKHT